MRRRYTRERYLELSREVREAVPDIALSTDMIVGFPGETDADFDETLSLDAGGPLSQHVLVQVFAAPEDARGEADGGRCAGAGEDAADRGAAGSCRRRCSASCSRRLVGSTQQVLVDGISRRRETELAGRTSGNTIVNFPGDAAWLGRLVDVRITGAGPNSLTGSNCASARGT